MAKYAWPAGSTSKTALLFIQDSASTTGAGKTGLTVGAVNVQEMRVATNNVVTRVTVSATNLSSIDAAYLSGGLIQIDATNCPGWYRFDIPDSALSTGAVTAGISIIGSVSASNVAQLALEIQLQNTPADMVQKAGVTVSVSTLFPSLVRMWDATSVSSSNLAVTDFSTRVNANVQAWAGKSVSTSDLAAFSVSQTVLTAVAASANITQWAGVTVSASNIAIKNTLAAGTHVTGTFAVNTTQWSGASVSTNNIVFRSEISLSSVNVTAWAGTSVSASNFALLDASTQVLANVRQWASVSTSASNIAINNTLAKTTDITGFNDISQATVSSVVLGTALTEGYAADGATFTIPQALYQIWSRLSEFSISSQIITAFRLDGTTIAMTFSLDDATAPTKVARVS